METKPGIPLKNTRELLGGCTFTEKKCVFGFWIKTEK